MMKRLMVFWIAAALVLAPWGATIWAEELERDVSAEAMTADLLLVRPIGIVATAAGCVIYLVSLPFSMGGDNSDMAYQKLVSEPAGFTFNRPLGDF